MSGYGEAFGNLIVKADENLRKKLMTSNSVTPEAISSLFKYYEADPALTEGMGFSVNSRKVIGKYIHLDTFGGEWIKIAKILSQSKTGHEIVGEFWDDYGGAHYIASDGKGSLVNFYFEEESDEMDQDDFDEEAYHLECEKKKTKWTSIVPQKVKHIFEE